MMAVTFDKITVTGGFWKQKQELIRDVTMDSVYKRFCETGRFDAFDFNWKDGMPNQPHIFWDSDVAKWLESVAYLIEKQPMPELERIVDETVDKIVCHQDECGYFNIYFTVCEPNERFKRRGDHELYCCGHLIEAAVAYYHATGKDKFLNAMRKYADYVEKAFVIDKSASFTTPGHEEIELALVKLYDTTEDIRYLNLSKFFIDSRGIKSEEIYEWAKTDYNQSHLPVREQREAVGHAVRAVYLYIGMADLALRCDDTQMKNACEALFTDIVTKRMYITGAIGASSFGETFSFEYDLPNMKAYAETCANLALALFCRRMQLLETNADFGDTVERIIYNGFLSGLSLDGKSFFYENPLEINIEQHKRANEHFPITQRLEVFGCSCCPPNVTRFIASIGDFIYTSDKNTVYIHQYITNEGDVELDNGASHISMESGFPYDGSVKIKYSGSPAVLALRIPKWYTGYNGETKNGYAYINVKDGDELSFDFKMNIRKVTCNTRIYENCGRCAIMYGPLVYCLESIDNGENLRDIILGGNYTMHDESEFVISNGISYGVKTITADAMRTDSKMFDDALYVDKEPQYIKFKAKLIPYFSFANRGESDMLIWVMTK